MVLGSVEGTKEVAAEFDCCPTEKISDRYHLHRHSSSHIVNPEEDEVMVDSDKSKKKGGKGKGGKGKGHIRRK